MDNFYRLFGTERKVKRKGIYEMFESEIENDFTEHTDTCIALAEDLLRRNKVSEALNALTIGIAKEPNTPYLRAARASVYLFGLNHQLAINDLKDALSIGGDNYIFYGEIGNSYNALNDFRPAEMALSIALSTKPVIHYADDSLIAKKLQFIKAKEHFEVLLSNRAAAKLGLNDFEGCISDCMRAKTYNPNHGGYKLVLGILCYKQGNRSESLNIIRDAANSGYLPAKSVLQQFFGIAS